MMILFYITILILIIIVVSLSVYVLKLARIIMSFEDQVEESLDILDKAYSDISYATSMDVFSDEPIIKNAITAVKDARNAVLMVANKLTHNSTQNDD